MALEWNVGRNPFLVTFVIVRLALTRFLWYLLHLGFIFGVIIVVRVLQVGFGQRLVVYNVSGR